MPKEISMEVSDTRSSLNESQEDLDEAIFVLSQDLGQVCPVTGLHMVSSNIS